MKKTINGFWEGLIFKGENELYYFWHKAKGKPNKRYGPYIHRSEAETNKNRIIK